MKQLKKSIEDKSEDEKTQSASTEILTIWLNKNIMNELHDDVDINKLYLKKELLNKINEIKIGRKIFEQ